MGSAKKKMIIGGVNEHYNFPWNQVITNKLFEEKGLDITWKNCLGGTGEMLEALENDEIQLAVLLTEGIITDIIKGSDNCIVGFWVNSPLVWGIHMNATSDCETDQDLHRAHFAISRFNSGSHLMAILLLQKLGFTYTEESFNVVKNLEGARTAMAENTNLAFLWEYFTTKPFVDNGEFKRVGEIATPWPSFVIACKRSYAEKNATTIKKLIEAVQQHAIDLSEDPNGTIKAIAAQYQLKEENTRLWFKRLMWNADELMNSQAIDHCQYILKEAGVVQNTLPLEKIIYEL